MRKFLTPFLLTSLFLFPACESTYKRATLKESIRDLAKKEYKLDVEVKENGETIGIQYVVPNLMEQLLASDQEMWKKMEDLLLVLTRTALSTDHPPQFLLLDVVDQDNPAIHLRFTRYVRDIQKLMTDAISRTQFFDRLLIEFEINGKKIPFDPNDADAIRLMLLMMESFTSDKKAEKNFIVPDLKLMDFLSDVASNTMRRELREGKETADVVVLRDIKSRFDSSENQGPQFRVFIDLVSKPGVPKPSTWMREKVLPFVILKIQDLFKSYKFDQFTAITVMEMNSGQFLKADKS